MKKQRLLELAGIASNMSNPSNEPGVGIPDNPSAHAMDGEDTPSDDEFGSGDKDLDMEDEVKELAMQGMNAESVEEAQDYFQRILKLVGEELEPQSDENGPGSNGLGSEEGSISFKRF